MAIGDSPSNGGCCGGELEKRGGDGIRTSSGSYGRAALDRPVADRGRRSAGRDLLLRSSQPTVGNFELAFGLATGSILAGGKPLVMCRCPAKSMVASCGRKVVSPVLAANKAVDRVLPVMATEEMSPKKINVRAERFPEEEKSPKFGMVDSLHPKNRKAILTKQFYPCSSGKESDEEERAERIELTESIAPEEDYYSGHQFFSHHEA
ncbi:hypothetical protein ZIOFF_042686 [Zingiber officinale]|uniref:Uncharacterized protein n=1 Tax=Zingiber officinale TaxID=94328 RepID=A0A8J5KNZ3_ZINOF|nr:hypothetical protein ZIOFF_042686 [Zingiber officinale]